MSIASPTLRSSSSTVPGPSLSRSPMSMRARPSTAETWTGTSNTVSRSAAMRVVGPSGSGTVGISAGAPPSSRLGNETLPSSLMLGSPQYFVCVGEAAPGADIACDGGADRSVRCGGVAADAAVRPFDAAIADGDIGLGEHDEAALETFGAHDVVELFARRGIERVVDAHSDVRRGYQLAEAIAGQRRDFGKRLARDQRRHGLARHRHGDLDGFAFEPGFDRLQRFVGLAEIDGD